MQTKNKKRKNLIVLRKQEHGSVTFAISFIIIS